MTNSTKTTSGTEAAIDFSEHKKSIESDIARYEDGMSSFASALDTLEQAIAECSALTSSLSTAPAKSAAHINDHNSQFNEASRKLRDVLEESMSTCEEKARMLEQELADTARKERIAQAER